MSNSLADQLLKAGVVSEEDVIRSQKTKKRPPPKKQANKPKQKKSAAENNKNQRKTTPSNEIANAAARKAVEAGQRAVKKDSEKKHQQQEAERRRLTNIQILDVLKSVKVETPEGEEKFNYPYQNTIRGIYVSKSQRMRLASGELAITVLKAKTKLIPIDIIDKIKSIDPARFIFIAKNDSNSDSDDDDYTKHQVPDDLMW